MFFYLDNTPTLGGPNDLLNAAGTVEGYVTNQFGQPLSGVRISFEHFWDYAYTDTNGYFSFTKLACLEELTFEKTGYPTGYLTVQVWPESTLTLNVNWGELTGIQFEPSTSPISMYELSQNYPNPFNPITTIEFTLPLQSEVTLTIYNPLGEVVETLVSDRLRAGRYSLKWNASQYPSGIYFYRLEASSAEGAKSHRFTQSKKLILLK
ncbi:MAG: T9SS type A sorting domain-containing protein [Aliifodinibius sp.]|nr:T9SS type A sorting domain-containing protein [Fodinibius sp.]NIV16689.1 T9SS type A sorting domain-containing protein [Fodinibius sp.]NIY29622.1 T9SS type A sorting domain-containing protein [Fodinibius sp.]